MPTLRDGLDLLKTGRLAEAETVYRQILDNDAEQLEARYFLGLVQFQRGQHDDAIRDIDLALALNPNVAATHNLRAIVLLALKRYEAAVASFDRAIALDPDDAGALSNRGIAFKELGCLEDAVASHDRAIALDPSFAEAFNNRGFALLGLERLDEALTSFDRAIELRPDYAAALTNRAGVLQKLKRDEAALTSIERALVLKPDDPAALLLRGTILLELERFAEALASFDQAIACSATAEAFSNRGSALEALGQLEDALAAYEHAIAIDPRLAGAFNNRGNVLHELGRDDEALKSYDKAIELDPGCAGAFSSRGTVLCELGRAEQALESYDRGIELDPRSADARTYRAYCRLLVGRFSEGLADYEWRWASKKFRKHRQPGFANWEGETVGGRRLLVFSEQGLGDVIQFARYLPLLAREHGHFKFLTYPTLVRLLRPLTASASVEVVTRLDAAQNFDVQCPLMSLPHRLHASHASIPGDVAYLRAEEELVAGWRQRIGQGGFKIGIAWQGNPRHASDRRRSIPLQQFFALAAHPGVRLISLQRQHGLEQLADLPEGVEIETLGADIAGGDDSFADTAAVIRHLDLVITCDTAIAHLAGALGHPTWIVLPFAPDWRWLLDRNDSPWYPTVRLFRQPSPGDWATVFVEVKQALAALLATS